MRNFKEKVAFITGGASGIGLGIAKAFADAGMKIVLADLRRDALDEAVAYFEKRQLPVHSIQLDVTDRAAYERAADETEKVFGKIHILVNNAGVGAGKSIEKTTFRDWDFGVAVNFMGVVNGILTILPRILKHGEEGHIVSTASMAALSAVEANAIYNATKSAVVALMETVACDLKNTNVGASVYCPGPVSSNLAVTSQLVRPDHLKNEEELAASPPVKGNPSANDLFMTPEEAGRRVLRGIERNDLYILTHPEFKEGVKARCDAILRAFPDEPLNKERTELLKKFGTLLYNPIYDIQTTPGPMDGKTE